jgi:hypothetical protein
MNNVKQRYDPLGSWQNCQLYRVDKGGLEKGNRMATYENVFDTIDEAHLKLAHVRIARLCTITLIRFGMELQKK